MGMSGMKTHKDLEVWKESINLAKTIYMISKDFPNEELYGLTTQMRRSAVSVASNIAEGAARRTKKEFIQYLYISLGSLSELETQLILSRELGLIKEYTILNSVEKIRKMLTGLIKHQKKSQ